MNGLGATVWKGSVFDCTNSNNEIVLLHSRYNTSIGHNRSCNGGSIVVQYDKVEGDSYTSLLTVFVNREMINGSIECLHDTYRVTVQVLKFSIRKG